MQNAILYVECPNHTRLPNKSALLGVAHKLKCEFMELKDDVIGRISGRDDILALVCNCASYDLFQAIRRDHSNCTIILVTDLPMVEYSQNLKGVEETLVDHIIAKKNSSDWHIHELRITIQKLVSGDIFGIEKYLSPNISVQESVVRNNLDREKLNQQVFDFAKSCNLGQHLSRMAFGICEELLMNTIYDAPLASGIERFKNIDQTKEVELRPEEQGTLRYACDGRTFAISTQDPFGALKKKTLFKYLKKVLMRSSSEGLIDTKAAGAGLGFFKILYSSHGIICNVEEKAKTEIMAIIHVNDHLRDFSTMTRSIHFFEKLK